MAIRTVHQVISKQGALIGEYMNLKDAKEMDNRTDVLYYVADLIEALGADEQLAEKIAETLIADDTRATLVAKLKSIKNLPTAGAEDQGAEP